MFQTQNTDNIIKKKRRKKKKRYVLRKFDIIIFILFVRKKQVDTKQDKTSWTDDLPDNI